MTMTKVLETQNKGRIFQEGSEKPNTKKTVGSKQNKLKKKKNKGVKKIKIYFCTRGQQP
jgi:hypothetical protein